MSTQTYTIKQIEDVVAEQGYKYCSLTDQDNNVIVPYNNATQKKITALKKIEEMKKRFKALPDGVYYVNCKNGFNPKIKGDTYCILKGNVTMQERQPQSILTPHSGDPNKVLSYQEALILAQKAMEWEQKYIGLKSQFDMLQGQYKKLDEEYQDLCTEEPGEMGESGKNFFQWADNTVPTLLPILDRYMALNERKQQLAEFRAVNRIDRTGAPMQPTRNGQNKGKPFPQPGTDEFEDYLNKLSEADEKTFEQQMMYMYKHHPEAYQIAYEELVEQEEEQEQEENKEGQE